MRVDLSLPDGYRAREIQGYLYLFDPQGIPLVGPTDADAVEAYAWRDVWRQIDRELNEELADLRAGIRPLHGLRRLRQYMRMVDATSQAPRDAKAGRPARSAAVLWEGAARWGAFAAAAAAIAGVFLLASLNIARVPENPGSLATTSSLVTAFLAKRPASEAPARASGNVRIISTTGPVETAHAGARAVRATKYRPPILGYVVSFGEFTRDASADSMMHFIRSKGYIVDVSPVGQDSLVASRPYRTRAEAARLANALQEIGLPAQLATTHVL
ncbi:MAG TPA: hypothetical protein VKZ50_21145 [bacterium]|nr:hypothetical protein [bacterium]